MISVRAVNYAKVLFDMGIGMELIKESLELIVNSSELKDALESPVVQKREKEAIIDKIFEKEIRGFMKVLCINKCIGLVPAILEGYELMALQSKGILKATLSYVESPQEQEIEMIKKMICSKYEKSDVQLQMEEDPSLIGGYTLTVGDKIYDKSIKGAFRELEKTLVRR